MTDWPSLNLDPYGLIIAGIQALTPRGELLEEPTFPGASSTHHVPPPLRALDHALKLRNAARYEAGRQITRARQRGHSWTQIAATTGDGTGYDAFRRFFHQDTSDYGMWEAPRCYWTCLTCGGSISDYGPEPGHPVDCEHGHEENCQRLLADVADWEEARDL